MNEITKLPENASLKDVIAKVNELSTKVAPKRDRGPASEKEMTEDMARRVMFGDLKDMKHKEAAVALGLSYGQVYSARLGFTFKKIAKEAPAKV